MESMSEREILEEIASNEFNYFLARRLNRAMADKNMTQADLVRDTMISASTISRYSDAKGCPSAYNLYKISLALDTPIEYFFS